MTVQYSPWASPEGVGHIRDLAVKEEESQLGVVNENVAIPLDRLHRVVAAQLPGIHRIQLHPFQQRVQALHHTETVAVAQTAAPFREIGPEIQVGTVRRAVGHPNVEQDPGHVALDVVPDLHQSLPLPIGTIPKNGRSGFRPGFTGRKAVPDLAEYHVSPSQVCVLVRGPQVVKIRSGSVQVVGSVELRPDLLPVVGARVVAIKSQSVLRTAAGVRPGKSKQGLGVGKQARSGFVHQAMQSRAERACPGLGRAVRGAARQCGQRLVAIVSGIVCLRLGRESRCGLMPDAGVGGDAQKDGKRQHENDQGAFHFLILLRSFCILHSGLPDGKSG